VGFGTVLPPPVPGEVGELGGSWICWAVANAQTLAHGGEIHTGKASREHGHETHVYGCIYEGERGKQFALANSLEERLWGDEWARHGDPGQLGHRDDGRGDDVEAVVARRVHVIAIKETVAQTTGFCPLVMPYELEMPGRRSRMRYAARVEITASDLMYVCKDSGKKRRRRSASTFDLCGQRT